MKNLSKRLLWFTLGLLGIILIAATLIYWLAVAEPDTNIESGSGDNRNQSVATVLTKQVVKDAETRGAVCNDGSEAIYYLREGSSTNTDKWIFWFKGGGGCSDEDNCRQHLDQDLSATSSLRAPETRSLGGIMSPDPNDNPDFYNWNHVMIHYCSSDTWTGDVVQSNGDWKISFRGDKIVEAVIEDLDIASASELILSGSSGGGTGAMHQLDDIVTLVPNVRVTGLIDSSWEIDYPAFRTASVNAEALSQEAYNYRRNDLDDSCEAAKASDPSVCFIQELAEPYIQTPAFYFINQYDRAKAEVLGVTNLKRPEQKAYLDQHAAAIRDSLAEKDGVFVPAGNDHVTLINEAYQQTTIDGQSFQEIFTNWYFDRPGPTKLIEEP